MYGLHHHLHTVEERRLRHLNLRHKPLGQILHDNSIGAGEETENTLDKVLFARRKSDPVLHILGEVELLRAPEDGHVVFVHFPEVRMLYGEDDEAVGVRSEKGFIRLPLLALRYCSVTQLRCI